MYRAIALIALIAVVASGCTATEQTQALSLAEELTNVSSDVNKAVASLFEALDQPSDNRAQLYERLLDLKLPTTFAILLDKTKRIEAPPGTDSELDRYSAFIAELLFASESLDSAIAKEDPAAVAIAAVTVEVSSGALAVVLPASSCASLTPQLGRDLCDPGGLEGYEAALGFELRRFVASFRPAFRVPDTFGDVIRGRVLSTLQADAALVLESTAARIDGLDPGAAYLRVHQVLLDYFPAAASGWSEFEADDNSSDPLIYGFIVNSLEEERLATQELLDDQHQLVLSALPNSHIKSITDLWFGPRPDQGSE